MFIRFASALFLLQLFAPLASALPLEEEFVVYREDFQGELSYPTAPEVDELAAGGMLGNSLPAAGNWPELTGTAAHAPVGGAAGDELVKLVVATWGASGVDSFGLRGRFEGLANLPVADPVSISVVAGFDPNPSTVMLQSATTLEVTDDPIGGLTAILSVAESEILSVPPATTNLVSLPLSPSMAGAIAAGAGFTLDHEFDRSLGRIRGSIQVDGQGSMTVAPLSLTLIGANLAIATSSKIGLTLPTPGLATEIDMTLHEVYQPFASTFDVDTPVDARDTNAGDGQCETAANECSLRAAIEESNALFGPDRINLPSGTYALSFGGTNDDVAARGDLDILDDLEIRGAGRDTTVVDGLGDDRVFQVPSAALDTVARLSDITIRGGFVGSSSGVTGGGIDSHGRLTLARCVVADNTAIIGAGVMNRRALWLEDCVVRGNRAVTGGLTGRGGGVAGGAVGAPAPNTTTHIRNSAIVGNIAASLGGATFSDATSVRIENSTISGNTNGQLLLSDSDAVLQHATIVDDAGLAIAGSGTVPGVVSILELVNTAVHGSPACGIAATLFFAPMYSGNNASNDTSCGFTAAGSVEGVALGLAPLAPLGDSEGHMPAASSPLIDASDTSFCFGRDQIAGYRPVDSDADGSKDCEIGAIEAPEPDFVALLASGLVGVAMLASLRRRHACITTT